MPTRVHHEDRVRPAQEFEEELFPENRRFLLLKNWPRKLIGIREFKLSLPLIFSTIRNFNPVWKCHSPENPLSNGS
jgi:hypothetical protein